MGKSEDKEEDKGSCKGKKSKNDSKCKGKNEKKCDKDSKCTWKSGAAVSVGTNFAIVENTTGFDASWGILLLLIVSFGLYLFFVPQKKEEQIPLLVEDEL